MKSQGAVGFYRVTKLRGLGGGFLGLVAGELHRVTSELGLGRVSRCLVWLFLRSVAEFFRWVWRFLRLVGRDLRSVWKLFRLVCCF